MSKLEFLAALYEKQVKERAPLRPVKILVGNCDAWNSIHSETGSGSVFIERDPTLQSYGSFKGVPFDPVEPGEDAGFEFRIIFESDVV